MQKLRFYLNQKLDEEMIEVFLDEVGGGVNFGEGIVKIHPQLKKIKFLKNIREKRKNIRQYSDFYYRSNKPLIKQKIKIVQKEWQKKEKLYVNITEKYFDNFKFSKGSYIAYASIINCNPRFLESKTFQFFYKKNIDDAVFTIAHELLHFIFFDFIKKELKNEIKELSEEEIWDLSEIFNFVVLGSEQYSEIINKKCIINYPNHEKYINQFQEAYKTTVNAKSFIEYGISIIKKNRK